MTSPDAARHEITPHILLRAYSCGMFPMAESADDPSLYWVEPERRGIFPLDRFHIPSRLARRVRADTFTVTADRVFSDVIEACAAPRADSHETWINGRIRALYGQLHHLGHAHSVECWDDRGVLAGGLYGVSLGRAFFGESMFHRERDASKVALVHLVAMLIAGGFALLDTQFVTAHLRTLGAIEISRSRYRALLDEALVGDGDFPSGDDGPVFTGEEALAIVAAHQGA